MGSPTGLRAQELGEAQIVAAFQPIFDLRDGSVVGYEALARPLDGSSPEQLFAAARAEGRLIEVDRECRLVALRAASAAGLGAPFALFLNADAGALELELPDLPLGGATLVMEITESALTERPETVLRTLTRLRTAGWGVSLDDVGADSRSLAVMPLLYPDVIKLDLRLLSEREPIDVARIVTAVGAEAERRHVTPTGMLLAAPDARHAARRDRYEVLRDALGFVGVLDPGALEDTWTEVALGPGYGACFVARCTGDEWQFATSYDRELVVECALLLMARLPQRPPPH